MKSVLIGGIGNVLLGDDGVGPYVARRLAAEYEFEEGVEVVDLGTPALDLIDALSGKDAVILIDSVSAEEKPGSLCLYRKADIMRLTPSVRMDPHSPALIDALMSTELFGSAPTEILLVGIRPGSYETGCKLTPSVAAAVEPVIAEVLRELDRLGVCYWRREGSVESGIWWAEEDESALAVLRR